MESVAERRSRSKSDGTGPDVRQMDVEPRVIRIDGGTQLREQINEEAVQDYAQRMIDGDEFPPVEIFCDEAAVLWCSDGHHRIRAALAAAKDSIRANVHEGSLRGAILFAAGANRTHGLRRSQLDKRKAVGTLLSDPQWAKRSDRWIAERCGVGHPLVADVRKATATRLEEIPVDQREGKDGKVRRRRHLAEPGPDDVPAADPAAEIQTAPTEEPDPPKSRGVGVQRANEAINCLSRIPKHDPLRKRGFQIVTDWIRHNCNLPGNRKKRWDLLAMEFHIRAAIAAERERLEKDPEGGEQELAAVRAVAKALGDELLALSGSPS